MNVERDEFIILCGDPRVKTRFRLSLDISNNILKL